MAAVGYGPGPLVTPLADALRAEKAQPGADNDQAVLRDEAEQVRDRGEQLIR
jgi:hypothetical protein